MTSSQVSSADPVRFYEFHRWLNPLANQRAVIFAPLEADEINARLRPHLFTWRYSQIPYHGLYGSIKIEGFILKRSMFSQLALSARYESTGGGTRLDLELSKSPWGVIGWGWNVLFSPFAAVIFTLNLRSHDILGPPHWIDTGALWQPGAELPDQPAIWLLFAAVLFGSFVRTIVDSYRQRDALDFYKVKLANILGARELPAGS